jgi:hypothetical protein
MVSGFYRRLKYRGGLHDRCFKEEYYVKRMSQPDTMPLFEILDCKVVLSLSQDGAFANPFVRVCLQTKFVKSANMILKFFTYAKWVSKNAKFYADIESVEKAPKNIIRKMLSPKNRQKN